MESPKVLFITSWYPTKEQPVEGVFVREHAKAVRFYNDVVVLHCSTKTPNLKGLWQIEQELDKRITKGIPTYRVWRRRLPIRIISYFNLIWSVQRGFHHIVSTGFSPDILHANIYEAGVPAVLIGKLYKIPVVITEHSTAFPRRLLSRVGILQAMFAFGLCDLVLPVSLSLQKAIQEYRIKAKFQVVPNVVDTTLFFPITDLAYKGNSKRLLFVGLLDSSHKKGVPYLLRALAKLWEKHNEWHLDIVGDGPARKEYEQLATDLGLKDKITFHGFRSKQEVAEFMRQADLFVLPSLFETFSVVAAEALTTGIPVLATHCGGPEEYITKDVGLIVPSGNTEALSKGLDYMLDHLEIFNPNKISSYAVERFSPNRVGKQLNKIYVECIEKYKVKNATAVQTRIYQ
jgi:glycosyltransferase involved in cell wall biosynthesis